MSRNNTSMKGVTTYQEMNNAFSWDHYRDACDWDARKELNLAHESIARYPERDKLALLWLDEDGEEERFTFADLDRESDRFANVLSELGVEKGTRVFTHLPRIPEHYISILGTLKTGAIFGAINERYGVDGVRHRLADSRPEVILTTPYNFEKVQEASSDIDSIQTILVIDRKSEFSDDAVYYQEQMANADPEFETVRTEPKDPALLYYTSGTTGPAKGVVHGHRFTLTNVAVAEQPLTVNEDSLYWLTADPGWLTGLNSFGAWFWGVPLVVYRGEFDPKKWVSILDDYPITHLWSVPTAYRTLKENDGLFDEAEIELENLISIGEPLEAPVIKWAQDRFGVSILDTYGTSETYGTVISNFPFMETKSGSMGKPYPGIDVEIVEPGTTETISDDNLGEIVIKDFPGAFLQYWEQDKKTAEKRSDGWIHTDDLAKKDEDGYFWFQGRADDVILSAGYRIGPFDVESTLVKHEAVTEAAVVPKPDEKRGHVVKAFVVPTDGTNERNEVKADIKEYVKNQLAAHEYPREIEFVHSLPKTVTGKIRKSELKERT